MNLLCRKQRASGESNGETKTDSGQYFDDSVFFDVVRVVIHKVLPEVKLRRVPMSLTIKIENEMRERGTRRPTQTVINDENENSMRKIKKL
ncbi:hypothetical protein J34TS1_34670 [Paenibacillus azoreducens]|uniref:Uncharacterized protein n=1 Tax=Paenibacillus azoreducens TaxID=116718 RepID=A0A920CTS8_9BACL|nr:hypothetical protein J34TS1_34670 [Paenibacillus azoreducens]